MCRVTTGALKSGIWRAKLLLIPLSLRIIPKFLDAFHYSGQLMALLFSLDTPTGLSVFTPLRGNDCEYPIRLACFKIIIIVY
jgi:hypothetical protein